MEDWFGNETFEIDEETQDLIRKGGWEDDTEGLDLLEVYFFEKDGE